MTEQPADSPSWKTVRPAKVKRARQLAQDPSYPPASVLRSIGRLFARHWKKPGKTALL